FHARAAYQWSVETTVYVHRERQRRGIGRALYSALLDGLSAQGYRTAVGIIALPNPESVGLHEHLGFRPAGAIRWVGFRHGRGQDAGWWVLPLADYAPPPPPPQPPATIYDGAAWREALARGAAMVRAGSGRERNGR